MADYARANSGGSTHFGDKDDLTSGDADKVIVGSQFDTEFNAIVTAVASKFESGDVATQAQAEGLTLDTVLLTPHTLNDVLIDNAGIAKDIQQLADPGADRILFWDDSAGAATFLSVGTNLSLSGTTLSVPTATLESNINHDNLTGFVGNEHINHTSVSIVAGTGLTGGGTIASSRTLNVVGGDGITANANDIALSSSVAGDGLTFSSGVINVVGGDGITATANDIDVDSTVVRTTGTQTIGGAKTFSSLTTFQNDVDIEDSFITSGVVTNSNNGTLSNIDMSSSTVVRCTGSAVTITGFTGGVDGKRVVVLNLTGAAIDLADSNTGSSVGNRLQLNGTQEIAFNSAQEFIYDATTGFWYMMDRFSI